MKIRRAQIEDIEALCEIEKSAFDKKYYDLLDKKRFKYLLTKANSEIWLVEIRNQVCGYIILLFRKNASNGRLYSIAVHQSFQGGQVGKNLLNYAEELVKNKHLKSISQEIREDNEKLYNRYVDLDYKICGMKKDYYPDGKGCLKIIKIFS